MKLKLVHREDGWWIVGKGEFEDHGPYRFKDDAEDDRRGLVRFLEEEVDRPATADERREAAAGRERTLKRGKACIACGGSGRSSKGHPCLPCGGTGKPRTAVGSGKRATREVEKPLKPVRKLIRRK